MNDETRPYITDDLMRPQSVDAYVGSRVRLRRTLLGMSQQKLSDGLGISFQQIQKYERGANRISASRLYDLARVLDVSISYFFDEFDDASLPCNTGDTLAISVQVHPLAKRETLELVRAYLRISDPKIKRQLFDLAKVLAGVDGCEPSQLQALTIVPFLAGEE